MDEHNARHIAESLMSISDTMERKNSEIRISGDLSDVDARDGIRLIVDAQNAKEALRVVFERLREAYKHDTVPAFVEDDDKEAFMKSAWDMRKLIWDIFDEQDALAYLKD
jgi:hypothetical protein